jgi:hypothetical protein
MDFLTRVSSTLTHNLILQLLHNHLKAHLLNTGEMFFLLNF